jgi:hypothetical protein
MKTKPTIIIKMASLVILACAFLLIRCKTTNRSDSTEITQFIDRFNNHIIKGDKDSLIAYFDNGMGNIEVKKLINILTMETGLDVKTKPLSKIALVTGESEILMLNPELAQVGIPVNFSHASVEEARSKLILKIKKNDAHQLKIIQIDARAFLTGLIAYENLIMSKTIDDKDIYSPITLKAFLTANTLKSKYDSVIWFAHIKQQTYFYVVKGDWEFNGWGISDTTKHHKMGLVAPDLKEIIPPEYDLIHNIGGTFDNLIEVENGEKKGFYDLTGKIVLPVIYDQIFPVNDDNNIAALKKGADFFWLKKDLGVSEKVDLKMADILLKLKKTDSFTLDHFGNPDNITEFNSRQEHGSIYLPPSYLVDLNLLPAIKTFKNPLRKNVQYEDVSDKYIVKVDGNLADDGNWFRSAFYKIRDYFLGGRSEFYDKKNVVIVDKKQNRILSADIITDYGEMGGESLEGVCDINSVKAINDTLFEIRSGARMYVQLYDTSKTISGGPYYHYLVVRNNKLFELPNNRMFGFTKYVNMTDSYLKGCYELYENKTPLDHLTPEILQYAKNEIYADYKYHFKDKRWREVFVNITDDYDSVKPKDKPANVSVDDSLTAIDKYNINFINQKLKGIKPIVIAAK